MKKAITFLLLITFSVSTYSENNKKQEAHNLARQAIELMDNGEVDKSIELLKKACKLDPKNSTYPYEMGYAYYLKQDYGNTIKYAEKATKMKGANDKCYQMLGNAYDLNKNREKAKETYQKGLKKFPNSGRLYLELGNIHSDDLAKALEYYEQGIKVEPSYPSNYYWAAKIFCSYTEEELWGMVYGELFMNIERNSDRTKEISKLLFDTYKSEIQFPNDSSMSVSFSKNAVIYNNKKLKIPFGMAYELSLLSAASEREITLASLNRIRNSFIDIYNSREFIKTHSNILFDWHKSLIKNGIFECYNYWLLMQGDGDEFSAWFNENEEKFNEFTNWFSDNPMPINKKNSFHRLDY